MTAEHISESEYITISEAAKMSDRSTRTLYNWIQFKKVEAKKEDEENSKSKWMISRRSLKIFLATEVKSDPPRKTTEKEEVEILIPKMEEKKEETVEKVAYESLLEDMKQLKSSYESKILQLEMQNKELHMKNEQLLFQKDQREEMIEFLKQLQPSMEGMRKEYEKKIEELTIQVYETKKELSIVQSQYDIECGKGILARIFNPPTDLKQLTYKE